MGKIVIISGPSGAGKTTVCAQLLQYPGVRKSISVTTRPPRHNEKNGISYHFVSVPEFEEMLSIGALAEHARYCGHYYGTLVSTLKESLASDTLLILEIEVQGALQIMEKFPEATSIFLMPPNRDTLGQRLLNRNTNKKQDIELRLETAEKELSYKDRYQHRVVNDNLEVTVDTVRKILGLA